MQVAVRAQNEFGLRLLSEVARRKPRANVLVSPASLFPALAMTETGAAGPTQAAMRNAMFIPPGVPDSEWHNAASALYRELRAAKGVELSMANAIWAPPFKPLAAAFIERCHDLYDGEAIGLDFERPDAADVINAWVKRGTKDKIREIVRQDQVAGSVTVAVGALDTGVPRDVQTERSGVRDVDRPVALGQLAHHG